MKKIISLFLSLMMTFASFTAVYANEGVASIGDNNYISLQAAIDAVEDGQTIKLLDNTTGGGAKLLEGQKNFIIDLNGKVYTFDDPAVGSTGTETQGLHLEKGNTVTIMNGTLEAKSGNSSVKFLIQNYCNLTLDGVTVDGTNLKYDGTHKCYTISNNCGTVLFNNSEIIAQESGFSFDSCKYASYDKPTVNVVNTQVSGKVEATGGNINFKSGTTVNGQVRVGENKETGACSGSIVAVEEGATISCDNDYSVVVFGQNTLNVEGTIKNTYAPSDNDTAAIGTNGNGYNAGSIINIKDGAVVESTHGSGIYLPNGKLNIIGGTITGETAVYFKSTDIEITGGTLKATGDKKDYVYNGNGGNVTGDALVIDNCNYPNGIGIVSVTGGIFESNKAASVASYTYGEVTPIQNFIESGTFSDFSALKYLKQDHDDINVKLISDLTITNTIDIIENVKLDLNGHAINGADKRVFNIKNNGKLEIIGNGTVKSTWTSENDSSVIRVGSNDGTNTDDSILVIGKGVTVSSNNSYGVTIFGKEQKMELVVDGKISTAKRSAISGNGTEGLSSTYIKINKDADISTTDQYAIYHPQRGTLIVDGKVTGKGGVELKAGQTNVSVNGTIEATAVSTSSSKNNNGTSTSGYALAVVENSGYYGGAKVTIGENARVKGKIDIVEDDEVSANKKGSIAISSGLYSEEVDSKFISKGYACKENSDATYKYKVVVANEETHDSKDVEGYSNAKVESFVTGDSSVKEAVGLLTAVDSASIVSSLRGTYNNNEDINVKVFLEAEKLPSVNSYNGDFDSKLDISNKGQVINDYYDLKVSQSIFVDGNKLSDEIIQPNNYLYIPIELRDDYNGLEARIIVFTKHGSSDPVQMQRAASKYDAERYNGNCYYIENGCVVIKSKDFSVYGIGLQTANVPEYRYVAPTTPKSKGYVAPKTGVE